MEQLRLKGLRSRIEEYIEELEKGLRVDLTDKIQYRDVVVYMGTSFQVVEITREEYSLKHSSLEQITISREANLRKATKEEINYYFSTSLEFLCLRI